MKKVMNKWIRVLWLTPDLAVPLQQILQVLRMGLSTDVRLIDNEITTSALLCQQHTRLAPSQLVTYKMTITTTEQATNRFKQNIFSTEWHWLQNDYCNSCNNLVGKVETLKLPSKCVCFAAGLGPRHPSIHTDLKTARQRHVKSYTLPYKSLHTLDSTHFFPVIKTLMKA